MTLALEKLFVIIGGTGLGLLIFGGSWRLRKPSADNTWNRPFYEKGPRDMRYGAALVLVSAVVLGLLQLVKMA